jgi:hypothetical protein
VHQDYDEKARGNNEDAETWCETSNAPLGLEMAAPSDVFRGGGVPPAILRRV